MTADRLISDLQLKPHPEGGWFRETWRSPTKGGKRAAATAILFLLKSGERSHWHRVDADEIWLWHGGDTLKLLEAITDSDESNAVLLGPPDSPDHLLQHIIPAGRWQAAEPAPSGSHGYVLVSCVVVPGFEFDGFELAAEGWKPGR